MTRGHAEDTKRHANSLPSTEARGRRHAARGADRDPHFFDRHPGRRRAAGGQHQERHRLEASHRGRVPRHQPAGADVDRRGQHRVVRLPGKRRPSDPADRLGGPGECPPACRGCAADRDHHRRERDRRHGDHPGALAAAGGTIADSATAAAQLHGRRFGLYKLTMRALLARHLSRGFSMVELMVAMVISLIGVIIIFQVFETSEGVRRTATSGGDAQQNGAVALYFMERDLRNAGMGINDTIYAGMCNMIGSDSSRTTPNFPPLGNPMILAPAFITAGANAQTPDQLSIFYGSQNQIGNSTTLVANMGLPTSPLTVQTRFGFRPGDLVLLLEPGSGKNCAFMEVTSLPGLPSNQINHDPGTYTLAAGLVSVPARFNPAAGMGVTYGGANTANVARVFNLGNLHDDLNFPASQNVTLPVYNLYAVANNTLTVSNAFVVAAGVPVVNSVADNIVHMRADYGVDDGPANDGILDRYISATPNWSQVIAIRIAVVARSALAEKPAGGGATCNTTTVPPTWSGDTGGARSFDLSADPDWKCYRYRMFETTVPLRNWIWKSS